MTVILVYVSYIILKNNGARFETWDIGVLGPVIINGLDGGRRDLSWQRWSYKVCVNLSYKVNSPPFMVHLYL